MEKLARRLAHNISSSLGYDDEKEAVVAYGLIAIIQVSMIILLVFIFGILISALIETLIVCLSVSILRKYSGGAHAGTAEVCTFVTVVYCTLTAFISKKVFAGIYNPFAMAAAVILVFATAFVIVYKLVPVDSPNKPIKTEKKIKRMRKVSFIILVVYFAVSLTFFILSKDSAVFQSYGISLLFGISWQIFTLTYLGSLFIGKINNVIKIKKEVQR